MQSDGIVESEKLVKTRLREVHWYLELGGLKCFGLIRFGGSFWYLYTPTYSLVDYFDLKGHKEIFC